MAVAKTHISTLFFLGDRVFKLKRPVRFAFLDFTTREKREAACRREVELNRRIAPDVYLGVATVLGTNGTPCDHLVVMRRMPADRRLSTLVTEGADVDEHLRRIARAIAVFHSHAETSEIIAAAGSRDVVLENWEENFHEMRPYVGRLLPEAGLESIEALAREYLAGRAALFSRRVADGRMRDGHGDLLADDIFCLDDAPRILDCIEFNDRLRYADVVADIAFLAMDLERLGRPDLGDRLTRWYGEFSGDHFPPSLADHFIAYRALVRSKVACIRVDQGEPDAAGGAVQLLRLARARLTRSRVVMLLVGGLPGTGKSTLALGLADARGWALLRSDEIRKDLAGVAHARRPAATYRADIYSAAMTLATYREMLARTRRALEMGESVVLDASWTDAELRAEAIKVARAAHAHLVQLRCAVPHAIAAARLHERNRAGADASDATPTIAREMMVRADPWPDARRIDTTPPADEVLGAASAVIDARPPTLDPPERLGARAAKQS